MTFRNESESGRIPAGVVGAVSAVGLAAFFLWGSCRWYTAQNRVEASSFSNRMITELSGKAPLLPGERWYSMVQVVPAGRSWSDAVAMRLDGTPINVRNYHGTYFPNGRGTKIIGKVAIGAQIPNVIFMGGGQEGQWGIFDCNSVRGWVGKPRGLRLGQVKVCAIHGDYLMAVDGSVNYGNGVIGPSSADQEKANR